MRKTIATLLAAALVVAPSAQAEGIPVTVEFQYDSEMLSTEAGAKQVLKSIKAQAAEACSFEMPVTRVETFDRACRKDLVEQAIGLIRLAAEEDGKAATYVFASL